MAEADSNQCNQIKFKQAFLTFCLLFVTLIASPASSETLAATISKNGANVIFLRHALAPGTGDPTNFDIGDCKTQRNLNVHGRAQARAIGNYFKEHQIYLSTILTSEWCRCRDTATEMGIGEAITFAGLNSFYQGHFDRQQTLTLLQKRLAVMHKDDLVLMITHQVVISAVTGIAPRSGGIVPH